MNRRNFFKSLATAAVSLPAVVKVLGEDKVGLWDWVMQFRRENGHVRVDAGIDAIDWMRERASVSPAPPRGLMAFRVVEFNERASFVIEQYPYRIHSLDPVCVIEPFINESAELGRRFTLNPVWQHAKWEAAVGYSLTTNMIQVAIFDRKSYGLCCTVDWIPMINQSEK